MLVDTDTPGFRRFFRTRITFCRRDRAGLIPIDTLELLDAVLTSEGSQVRVADSASEAFEIFSDWQPDVLISDIGMPDEDGYSLIKKVRRLPLDKGGITPAIAMTAYGRDEDRLRVLASGFHHYTAKPAEPLELITTIVDPIGKKKPV